MFKEGFVATIKVNDKFVDERPDGTCLLPFDSEYSIRLKNRNDRKAVARIYIDGEEVNKIGRFILDANSTLDLERFVENLDQGRRFKFVPLLNGAVADKNNFENGAIEVHFQLVAPVAKPIVIEEHHHHHRDYYDYFPYRPYWWYDSRPYYVSNTPKDNNVFFCNSGSNNISTNLNTGGNGTITTTYTCASGISSGAIVEKGATIKGSESRQKFSYSYVGELESQETIIRLHLIGTMDEKIVQEFTKVHCAKCGKKYLPNDVYCASCGEKK